MKKFKLSFTGCGLCDFIYNNVDFNATAMQNYRSKTNGDGGIAPGKLVFTPDLEKFSNKPFHSIISEITKSKSYNTLNIGGPALVGAICASQLLYNKHIDVSYYGAMGDDNNGKLLLGLIEATLIENINFIQFEGTTPYTTVLSDPNYNNQKGERSFINNIGVANNLFPQHLNQDFWDSQIIVFGATALVPNLHSQLHTMLQKAKQNNAFTVVCTVFDFINESKNKGKAWPLGNTNESLPLIDLLIMDYDEALAISATNNIDAAIEYYINHNCNAFIITHGSEHTYLYSSGKTFMAVNCFMPVCNWISDYNAENKYKLGDTTGCGDNFAGATIASIAKQLKSGNTKPSLVEAAILGTAAGGFTCYHLGGTFFESHKGEKQNLINAIAEKYIDNKLHEKDTA